jgi:hypothetical protein
MMNIDWGALLARKYDLMQQQADTQRMGMTADANLADVRAGLLPSQAASDIRLADANVGFTNQNAILSAARARQTDEETKTVAPLARAEIGFKGSQSRLLGSQATGEDQLNRLTGFRLRGLGDNLGMLDQLRRQPLRYGLPSVE